MPGEIQPVGAMIQPPNPQAGINTLSGIIGLKQQQQTLQTGQYQQATAQADSQQAQQKNMELTKAQSIAINGAKSGAYDDGQGGLNRQKMADDILKVAPVYGQSQVSSLLSQANEVVANKQAHQNLTLSQKKEMGATFASLASDANVDNTKYIDAVEKLRQAHPNDPEFSRMLTSMTTHYPGTASADQQRQILGRWSAAATGEPQSAPSTVDTGTQIQPGATSKFGGGFTPAGAPINKQSVVTTPAGPLGVATPARGTVSPLTTTAPPGSAPGAAPPPNLNTTNVQQQTAEAAAKNASEGIETARVVGDQAPSIRNVNSQLLKLSQETATGPGTQAVQQIRAMLGMSSGSNYQEISAYLDRQAAMQARTMGLPNTNAGLAASQSATGTTEYTPKALQEKVKFADALNTGASAYRQGLDKAVGTGASPDIAKYQAYRSAWAQNFDPDVFRAEDAQRRGDETELKDLKKRLGPQGMKILAQKSVNLRELENGRIPP